MEELKTNTCKFSNGYKKERDIVILNFVRETDFSNPTFVSRSDFRFHIVASGEGCFSTFNRRYDLEAGDVFLTNPSTSYSVSSKNNLEMYYISFLGLNGYDLIERTDLGKKPFIKRKSDLLPFWKEQFEFAEKDNIDLIAESVLLYSFGHLCIMTQQNGFAKRETTVLLIKKQLDDNFTDPGIELNRICRENYYNPKYISTAFKKVVGMTFSTYLLQLRLNNTSNLIENGLTSIKQIALLSGFSDANYFARVFKKTFGITPTEYIIRFSKK